MPLVDVAKQLGIGHERASDEKLQVVVYFDGGRSVGLVVGQIVDVVEQSVVVERAGKHGGLAGSAVLQDRVTDLLDVSALVRQSEIRQPEVRQSAASEMPA